MNQWEKYKLQKQFCIYIYKKCHLRVVIKHAKHFAYCLTSHKPKVNVISSKVLIWIKYTTFYIKVTMSTIRLKFSAMFYYKNSHSHCRIFTFGWQLNGCAILPFGYFFMVKYITIEKKRQSQFKHLECLTGNRVILKW